jgi:hypothetical protein
MALNNSLSIFSHTPPCLARYSSNRPALHGIASGLLACLDQVFPLNYHSADVDLHADEVPHSNKHTD